MAGKPDEWMPLHVRRYLGDTMHLTRDQHGAYLLLLMAYWLRGGALPANDNELAAIAKATKQEWARLKPVLAPFFECKNGAWIQKRAEQELAKARRTAEAKTNAGTKGAQKRWQSDSTAMAEPLAETESCQWQADAPKQQPSTKNQEPEKQQQQLAPAALEGCFVDFYEAFPRKEGKKAAFPAYCLAAGRISPDDLLAAAKRYAASTRGWEIKFILPPARWLSEERYTDEAPGTEKTAFNSPEEIEGQRLARERHGQARH